MKKFNTTGPCIPQKHYMADMAEPLAEICAMVRRGDYFTINRARQYGKTTMLAALAKALEHDYAVISLDFQKFSSFEKDEPVHLRTIFKGLLEFCRRASKPCVLIIDEADSAADNQVFLDFLAQLRSCYLDRELKNRTACQSVILADIYDIRNIRRKIRPDEERRFNSPWNIAADFDVKMSLSRRGIAGMLSAYESDRHTGMDIGQMASLLYEYTSGYPFLVSRLCWLMDEKVSRMGPYILKKSAWTQEGFLQAVRLLLAEK